MLNSLKSLLEELEQIWQTNLAQADTVSVASKPQKINNLFNDIYEQLDRVCSDTQNEFHLIQTFVRP
ncbi:MAG: hypothetical protein AAFQ41_17220, partial [Cyanobacteria bacterium J06623_7]